MFLYFKKKLNRFNHFVFTPVIFGYEHKGVVSAYTQIHLLVLNVRKQLPKTHFISIPLSSPAIKAQFLNFQKQVISSNVKKLDENKISQPQIKF